jgi:hypothetical protein
MGEVPITRSVMGKVLGLIRCCQARSIQLQGEAEQKRVALQQVLHLEFVDPAELDNRAGLLNLRSVEDHWADTRGPACEALQHIGLPVLSVVGNLCEVGTDHTEPDPLGHRKIKSLSRCRHPCILEEVWTLSLVE